MSEPINIKNNQQANSEPLVTVGLPTFNRPVELRKCLETIVHQTYNNLQIIISDNCSTDEQVQQVILEFAAKDSRIRHFRQIENIGLEENFNFVYAQATAEYFMWVSDDDYYDSNYVASCIDFLQQHPDHVLCSGVAKYYSGGKFLFDEKMFRVDKPKPFGRILKYFTNAGKNGNFYGVFRNHLLQAKPIGPHPGCDWSFMAKLGLLGKLSFVSTTSYHRSADGNSGTKQKMIKKFGLNKMQSLFFETYSAYQIASNIFNDSAIKKQYGFLSSSWLKACTFVLINYRLFTNFIRRKAGFK